MPADEGSLIISAQVDKGAFTADVATVQELTRKAAEGIAVDFQECSTKTRAAMRNLSDDVKAAADSVTQQSIRVAEATKAQAQAMADVRRASVLMRDEQTDAALSARLMAAAQDKVAAAAAEKAEAVKASAAASARAAEEEGLSTNAIARAWQRASMQVRESTAEMNEHFGEVARNGKLTAYLTGNAFGGLGELLGAGIAVQFGVEFVNELAKINLELDHLSVKTGISITSLAGLQQIVKGMNGEWEPVENGLVRLSRAQVQASEGAKSYRQAFADLGITMDEVSHLNPEQILNRVSRAIQDNGNAAVVANSAITLFGRGGAALIPVLKEQGENLTKNMKLQGEQTGITDQSAAAARRWTEDMTRLTAELRRELMPVLEYLPDVLRGIAGAFQTAWAAMETAVAVAVVPIVGGIRSVVGEFKVMWDVMHGDFSAARADAAASAEAVKNVWKDSAKEISNSWKRVGETYMGKIPAVARPDGGTDSGIPDEGGSQGSGKGKTVRSLAFQRDEDELNALKVDHLVSLAEEQRFWEAKLATAHKGSDEYRQIMARLAGINQREDRQKAAPGVQPEAIDLKPEVDAFLKAGEEEIKSNNEVQKQRLEAFRSERDEEIRLSDERVRDLEQDTAFEVSQGRMTAEQRLAILRKAVNDELEVKRSALAALEALDAGDLSKYQQYLNRELEMNHQYQRQVVQLDQQTAMKHKTEMQGLAQTVRASFQSMTNEINRSIAQWVVTGKGFQQSMAQVFNSVAQSFIQSAVASTEKWLATKLKAYLKDELAQHLSLTRKNAVQSASDSIQTASAAASSAAQTAAMTTALTTQTAAAAGAAATQQVITAAADVAKVTSYAAVAGAGETAATLNPAAGAAMFAAVMASYGPLAAFNEGGIVSGVGSYHVPILAKQGERILTPNQNAKFEQIADGRVPAPNQSASDGGHHIHVHYSPTIHAFDRQGFSSTLRAHRDDVVDVVRGALKTGALKPA